MNSKGNVALITGAASGIGAEAAHHLAKLSAKLALIDLNEKQLIEVADKITQTGASKPFPIVADISNDAQRIINQTIEHFGQLDILVNSAGVCGADSVDNFDVNQFDRIMNVNLRSMIVLTNSAVPHLEKTKGNIINISSVSGLTANGEFLSYCISRAAVNQFTKCSAVTLASKGIRSNAIAPGIIRTPIYSTVGLTTDAAFEHAKGKYLVKRPGEPSEIATGIAYLATHPFVNGIVLPIDGGFMCSK